MEGTLSKSVNLWSLNLKEIKYLGYMIVNIPIYSSKI